MKKSIYGMLIVYFQRIHHDQARLRIDLQSLIRSKRLNWTLEDDTNDIFSPQVNDDAQDTAMIDTPQKRSYPYKSRKQGRRPPRLPLPPADDLRWLMRYLRRDIFHSSRYLDSLPAHPPRLKALPEPFYAPCLRIIAKKIYRLIL